MPPVFSNYLTWIYLVVCPELSVAVLVEVDSLENVVVEIDVRGELALVVRAVETHLQSG